MLAKDVVLPRFLPGFLGTAALLPCLAWVSSPTPPKIAQPAQAPAAQASADILSVALKELLVQMLPGTLYESAPGWGNRKRVPSGVQWPGQGIRRRPEVQYSLRNDGTWRKVRLMTDDAAHSLQISLSDLRWDDAGRLTFTAAAWVNLRASFEQQRWEAGVRIYSVSARARVRVKLTLRCEAGLRLEMASGLLPDMILRFGVVGSEVAYDHLVVEHLAGMGGTGARWLGELVRTTLHELRPSVERNLLARANAALRKAGASREVRLALLTWVH